MKQTQTILKQNYSQMIKIIKNLVQVLKKCIHPWPKQIKGNYTLRYATYIDGETYAFMKAHKGHDLW